MRGEQLDASASPTGPLGLRPEPQEGLGHEASVPLRKKNNRACGARFELEVVKFLCAGGLDARKRFMSGQLDGEGDIDLHQRWGELWPLECKWKKALPQWIVNALGKNRGAIIKEARGEPFILLRLSDFRDLCQ